MRKQKEKMLRAELNKRCTIYNSSIETNKQKNEKKKRKKITSGSLKVREIQQMLERGNGKYVTRITYTVCVLPLYK